ncbi:MAG: HNH endonuclease [Azonexus sp.]|nr:HNH endonuclease [Azonexus sp.]
MARDYWSNAQIEALQECYPDYPAEIIAAALGRSLKSVYGKANALGLEKSAAFKASRLSGRLDGVIGKESRFQNGHTPWNKNMKGLCHANSVATQFKPGHLGGRAAERLAAIGAERLSKEGYLVRKINNDLPMHRRWRFVHLLLWEAAHGPLPPGHALCFKDGDKRNITLENLELITRGELMARNTIHRLPPELKEVTILKRSITRHINRKEKEHEPHR